MEVSSYKELRERYEKSGMARKLGFGDKPAVIVIDFIKAFTDERSYLGMNLTSQLEQTLKILREARRANIPIIFTTTSYRQDFKDAGLWAKKVTSTVLVEGSEFLELDPILERRPEETIITKKFASAFFGTDLVTQLISQRVDTLIMTGCTTSGCVRATVMDAINYGFAPIVVEEAVGDRAQLPHEANLFDINAKYGDVVSVDEVMEYLSKIG